ncbi:DUF4166 domain-containing protein [Lysobacter enzymogenes]|nr:DUF4166 domain-containing protein [Lysobacter enzymogenes]
MGRQLHRRVRERAAHRRHRRQARPRLCRLADRHGVAGAPQRVPERRLRRHLRAQAQEQPAPGIRRAPVRGSPRTARAVVGAAMTNPSRDASRLGAREGLYPRVLGVRFVLLPRTLRLMHGRSGRQTYRGEAKVERGSGLWSRLFARIVRLPAAYAGPIEVEVVAGPRGETWTRRFGKSRMRSRLAGRDGLVLERLGPMRFAFALEPVGEAPEAALARTVSAHTGDSITVSSAALPAAAMGAPTSYGIAGQADEDGIGNEPGLVWRLMRVRAFGLPLPAGWFARVQAREFEREGRYHFEVDAQLPGVGLLVRYRGWLDVGE